MTKIVFFHVWMCTSGRDRFLKSPGGLKQLPLMRRLQSLNCGLHFTTKKRCYWGTTWASFPTV